MPKGIAENYRGRRFASLIVLDEFKSSNNQYICKVKCDCGREFELVKRNLQWRKDHNTRCNCRKKDDLDIIDKKFGQLTVISFSRYNKRQKLFWCKCDCGRQVERTKMQITHVCGCGNLKKHNTLYNIVDKKFGKLRVIEEVAMTKHKQRQFKCICDCGTEKIVLGSNLIYGGSTSCGCTLNAYYQEGTMINLLMKNEAYSNSKSGIKGVWQDKAGHWRAIITVKGERKLFYGGAGEEGKESATHWRTQMVEKYHQPLIEKYQNMISK